MQIDILFDQPMSPHFAAGDARRACAFPQSFLLDDGRVASVYRQGAGKHSADGILVMQTSADQGRTWAAPQTVFDGTRMQPTRTVISGGACQMRSGALVALCGTIEGLPPDVYMFSAEGMKLPYRVLATRSDDGGRTWSPPTTLDTAGYPVAGVAARPLALPDGTVYAPVEVQLPGGPLATAAAFSRDDGRTFGPLTVSVVDTTGALSLCDAHVTPMPDGRLLMLLWTFRQDNEETIPIRRALSSDGGRTWSAPQATNLLGQVTQPLALASGVVLAASNYRLRPEGSRLWLSRDAGLTWAEDEIVQLWDPARSRMVGVPLAVAIQTAENEGVWEALQRFTFGTPDLVALPDGSILYTYWAQVNDIVHTRACRFRLRGM